MRLQACGVTSQRVPSEFKANKLDPWYEWLIHSRHAGDPVERRLVLGETERYADKVLAAAQLTCSNAPGSSHTIWSRRVLILIDSVALP